ncbi:MAG: metallophosphoesterase family protein [Myxococcaceae bacterium]|nr:metallophosphoesterase family protein [Myxococcaceae bacterium]
MERIGVVSDTHGLFDEKLARLFEGVSLILHGGDIGEPGVLTRLTEIAPVRAVAGNNDTGPWARELPAARVERVGGSVPVLVVHDLGKPAAPTVKVQFLLSAEDPRVVVSGHSHKGELVVHDGRLFVNPGGAGKKRFKLLRSAAVLEVSKGEVVARLFSLEDDALPQVAEARLAR